jgi:hypothetical protein
MKVNNKKSGKPFGDLVIGNVFLYEEEAFMVIQSAKSANGLDNVFYNAVNLSDDEGWLRYFDDEIEVILVEAELTVF